MSYIYTPRGRAREYSPLAINIYRGCDHRCPYCYVPSFLNMPEEVSPRIEMNKLRREVERKKDSGELDRQVLLCFTCDPYCGAENRYYATRDVLRLFEEYQVPTAILTKGGLRVNRDTDIFRQFDSIKVGQTVTLLYPKDYMEWEPNAPSPVERLRSLRRLHNEGIRTFISMEPVIDPIQALKVIDKTHEYVDEYLVGKLNVHRKSPPDLKEIEQSVDWRTFTKDVVARLRDYGKDFYLKESLQEYMDQGLKEEECQQDNLALGVV